MSLAKKKKASHNIIADLYKMSFKIKGGQNLRFACMLCMKNIKTSSAAITPEQIDSLPKKEQEIVKSEVISSFLDEFVKNLKQGFSSKLAIVVAFVKENLSKLGSFLLGQIAGGENFISRSLREPINKIEKAISVKLKSMTKPNSIIDFLADIIIAETPEEISRITSIQLEEVKSILKEETSLKETTINKVDIAGNIAKMMWGFTTTKFFAFKLSLSLVKAAVVEKLILEYSFATIGHHIVLFLSAVGVVMLFTDIHKAANILKKLSISLIVISSVAVAKLIPYIKKTLHTITSFFGGIKDFFSFKNAKQKVLYEAIKLARGNKEFYSLLNQRLVY